MHTVRVAFIALATTGTSAASDRAYTDICRADVAVVGTVTSATATRRPGTQQVFTKAVLSVEAQYRGPPLIEVDLWAPGGRVDGRLIMAMGHILLDEGMRYLVFIQNGGPGSERDVLAGWQRVPPGQELPDETGLRTWYARLCDTHLGGISSLRDIVDDYDPLLVPPSIRPWVDASVAAYDQKRTGLKGPNPSDVRAAERARAISADPSILYPAARPQGDE